MRVDFILKAHEWAPSDKKKEIEKCFPYAFDGTLEIPFSKLKVGKWYKCENLVAGCMGFNGYGRIGKVGEDHICGLFHTDKGICLKGLDGQVWRVNGTFYLSSRTEAKKHYKPRS